MGMLDDAIREHLELKRRRGADPGEVAREQREALDPVFPGESSVSDRDPDSSTGAASVDRGETAAESMLSTERQPDTASLGTPDQGASAADAASTVSQETAELDMQSVLHDDDGDRADPSPAVPRFARPAPGASPAEDQGEDSLEWQMPDASLETPAPESASQEGSATTSEQGTSGGGSEPDDRAPDGAERSDVRDTPDQERLSFE